MTMSVNLHCGLQGYDTLWHGGWSTDVRGKKTGSSSVSDDGGSIVIRNTGDRIPNGTRHSTKLHSTQGHRPSHAAKE